MSFDIPGRYDLRIEQVANTQRITTSEAVERIVEAGLDQLTSKSTAQIPGLTGCPMSDEDAALMDEVVELAMRSRSI